MSTLPGLARLVVVTLLLAPAGGIYAQKADIQKEAQAQQQRRIDQPGNNAPVWREVRRDGQEHFTSIPGRETGVLVQARGDVWRQLRNGPFTVWGGFAFIIVCAIIAALYFLVGAIRLHQKPSGRLLLRFDQLERWTHWTVAISFCILAVSGLIMLFGKHVLLPVIGYTLFAWLTALGKNLHNFVGPVFIVGALVMIAVYIRDNLPKSYDFKWFASFWGFMSGKKHVPSGRFNAGEKVWFWFGVVLLTVVVSVSGLILLFPNFDQTRATMQDAWLYHAGAAIIYMLLSLGHIYMGTIGVEGSYQAMRTGYVDEVWAKEHHEYWYNEVKSGKASAKPADAAAAPQAQH